MDRRRSSHIVPEIYEATINPDHWDYVVSMIAKLTKSSSACLYYKNKGMEMASTIAQYDLPNAKRLNFRDHCNLLNDLLAVEARKRTSELPFVSLFPINKATPLLDRESYPQWMASNDVGHICGAQFIDTETHCAGLVILRPQGSAEWAEGELRIVNEILPHLKRAVSIYSEFTHLRLRQDALLKGLDRLVIGLILYDHNAQPVYINPTAEATIEQHPGLKLQNGDLFLLDPDDERALRKTILDTAQIDPDDSWKQSVAIGITHPDVESPLPILVTPMHAHLITSDLDYEGAKVAVFLSDPNLKQPISTDSLASVYGLSPSEAQVSISLTNGHSIEEIASLSSHSVHTIRSQLKSVFRKTGVSRQSELIKLLLTGALAQRRRSSRL